MKSSILVILIWRISEKNSTESRPSTSRNNLLHSEQFKETISRHKKNYIFWKKSGILESIRISYQIQKSRIGIDKSWQYR